ncbi:MAG: YczE/YyaS/YitT family protein [Butyricicoccus sp.]
MFQNYMRRLFWLILVLRQFDRHCDDAAGKCRTRAVERAAAGHVAANRHDLRHSVRYRRRGSHPHGRALRQSFGFGTIINIAGCAVIIDAIQAAHLIPQMHGLVSGIAMLIGGLELLALGTWLYMKSALGSGPRDALMVALARKFGRSVGACRAVVDVLVTVIGFFLGGPVGVGTIISAVGLGPLINLNFAAVRFNPAEVHQENAAETIAKIAGKR